MGWHRKTQVGKVVGSRTPARVPPPVPSRGKGIGDRVAEALQAVGITDDRVSRWLGRPCGCKERREKLNALGFWAARVLAGNIGTAEVDLTNLVNEK